MITQLLSFVTFYPKLWNLYSGAIFGVCFLGPKNFKAASLGPIAFPSSTTVALLPKALRQLEDPKPLGLKKKLQLFPAWHVIGLGFSGFGWASDTPWTSSRLGTPNVFFDFLVNKMEVQVHYQVTSAREVLSHHTTSNLNKC